MNRWLFGVCAALGVAWCPTPARAQDSAVRAEDAARAEELFRQGTDAFEAARYSDAYAALRSSWDLSHGYRNAAGLGQVEIRLEQYRDAAEHLSFCLRHFPADGDSTARGHVEQGLAEAREHLATLRVSVSPTEATLSVDDRPVPAFAREGALFVDPGTHIVAASLDGYAPAKKTVDVAARMSQDLALQLIPASAFPAAATPSRPARTVLAPAPRHPATAPDEAGLTPRTWVLIVGGALTAVAAGTAVLFDFKGSSAESDREDLRAQLGSNPAACSGPTPEPSCVALRNATDRRDHYNALATGFAIGSAVMAVATLGAALAVPASDSPREARPLQSLRLAVGHSTASVLLSGHF